jgi:peptidyl-prolyl cis-trans isomerase NIMA-interacting 1
VSVPARTLVLVLTVSCAGKGAPSATAPGAAAPSAAAPRKEDPGEACVRVASATHERGDLDESPSIAVKHILIKHAFAKNADRAVKRSREEACLRALEAHDKIRAGAEFGAVVREYSEEPGAAASEGSIGFVDRGDLSPPFADAAFRLDVEELSDVVETEYGFHVILRTE